MAGLDTFRLKVVTLLSTIYNHYLREKISECKVFYEKLQYNTTRYVVFARMVGFVIVPGRGQILHSSIY